MQKQTIVLAVVGLFTGLFALLQMPVLAELFETQALEHVVFESGVLKLQGSQSLATPIWDVLPVPANRADQKNQKVRKIIVLDFYNTQATQQFQADLQRIVKDFPQVHRLAIIDQSNKPKESKQFRLLIEVDAEPTAKPKVQTVGGEQINVILGSPAFYQKALPVSVAAALPVPITQKIAQLTRLLKQQEAQLAEQARLIQTLKADLQIAKIHAPLNTPQNGSLKLSLSPPPVSGTDKPVSTVSQQTGATVMLGVAEAPVANSHSKNQPKNQIEALKDKIDLYPNDPEPYYELARLEFSRNHPLKAFSYLTKYYQLNPKATAQTDPLYQQVQAALSVRK